MENRTRGDRRGSDRRDVIERRKYRPWVVDLADRRSGFDRRTGFDRRNLVDRRAIQRAIQAGRVPGRLSALAVDFMTRRHTGFPVS